MRKVAVAALAITIGVTAMAGLAQSSDPFGKARLAWNLPQTPFQVIRNVYYVGPAGVSAYLIVTPEGNILTDGGLPESADQIEANIKALGFNIREVKILLNSHAHFDHAGGLAQLKRDSGAILIASGADKPYLENGRIDFGPSAVDPFPPVKVDRVIHDGETISLGGVHLTAMVTPGHTPGCTNWLMPLSEGGVPHKVIFFCSITTGGNPLVDNRAYPSIAVDYKASFARLKEVSASIDVFLAPHGDQMDLSAKLQAREKQATPNPFIDKSGFSRLLAAMEKNFDDELARQQTPQPAMASATQDDVQRVTGDAANPDSAAPNKPSDDLLGKLFVSTLVVDNVPAVSYVIDQGGLFTVVLATGEIWTQQASDTARAHWRTRARPLLITIRQGSLGTFNLAVRGDSNHYEVRPLLPHS